MACSIAPINFNPRPPRGGRPSISICANFTNEFQSTPSARRATVAVPTGCLCAKISIHALREEGDALRFGRNIDQNNFNPRPPRGGRQLGLNATQYVVTTSIHALREEGDRVESKSKMAKTYFNPRPPRGGRPSQGKAEAGRSGFQSTPSARRATAKAAKNPPRLFHYTHLCTI